MRCIATIFLVLLLAGVTAFPAQANLFLSTWGGTQTLYLTIAGSNYSGGVGQFHGQLDGVDIGRVWCLDFMNYAGYSQWQVTVHTDATSWSSNDPGFSGEDDYRGNWGQVAWLVHTYGTTNPDFDHTVALHGAIYKAAYGTYLTSMSGMTGTQVGYMNTYYSAATGQSYDKMWWFDNDDLGTNYQDFGRDVPEPSVLLLIGGALAGLAIVRTRRR